MSGIRAIETEYKGFRFRSRLEARWAVFFDALGLEWRYETQGYEKRLDGDLPGGRVIRYLPDFYLPATRTWVEVKGSDEALLAEAEDLEYFLDFGCPLFARHPITSVRLTDCVPGRGHQWFANRNDNGEGHNADRPADPNWLPWQLAQHLGPAHHRTPLFGMDRHEWVFARQDVANLALSAACVALGRQRAGLLPLKPHL